MPPPTVLVVHNYYRERGGEDEVADAEIALLARNGWRVLTWTERSREPTGAIAKLKAASDTFWSRDQHRRLSRLLATERVDVAHLHNTFPRISPSVIDACKNARIPVVATLHNYRPLCAAATLFRNGAPCEDCVGRALPLPAVLHRCYQSSLARTSVVAGAILFHRARALWSRGVDRFITLSETSRRRFLEAGFPAEKLVVKANFVDPDPGPRRGAGRYAVYVGRLSEEKGIRTLLEAWRELTVPLKIVGEGPMSAEVAAFARESSSRRVEYLGRRTRAQVLDIVREARLLVFPSLTYECGPLTILEAFACGVPVLSSDTGAAPEFVLQGNCGWTFAAGDAAGLAAAASNAWNDTVASEKLGHRARQSFEKRFTATRGYAELSRIYRQLMAAAVSDPAQPRKETVPAIE